MNAAGTAVTSPTFSRLTTRSSCTSDPSMRRRSSVSVTVEFLGPASTTSSSSALVAVTGCRSTAMSSSPGRMSSLAAFVPGAMLLTTGEPPKYVKLIATGCSLPSRSAFSFSALSRMAGITNECGSASSTSPWIAAMISAWVSCESGWLTRIWLSTPESIWRSSYIVRGRIAVVARSCPSSGSATTVRTSGKARRAKRITAILRV